MTRWIRWGLYALILWTPLPFASVQPGGVLIIELAAFVIGALSVYEITRGAVPFSGTLRLVAASGLLALLLGLLQTVPAFPESPDSSLGLQIPHNASLAAAPHEALDASCRLASVFLLAIAAYVSSRDPADRRRMALLILCSAALQSAYGVAEYLSGHQHIFAYAKRFYLDCATGTFINRNHFAGYLALAVPFGIAAVAEPAVRRTTSAQAALPLARIVSSAALVLIWTGVLLSFSRGGLAIALLATLLQVLYEVRRRSTSRLWLLFASLVAPIIVLLAWTDVRLPAARWIGSGATSLTSDSRLDVWPDVVRLASHRPWIGVGMGGFEASFWIAQSKDLSRKWDHAHNEYLEIATELGAPGLVLAFAVVGAFVTCYVRAWRRDVYPRQTVPFMCATVAFAAHAGFDFVGRIPALAVIVAIVGGAALAGASTRVEDPRPFRPAAA